MPRDLVALAPPAERDERWGGVVQAMAEVGLAGGPLSEDLSVRINGKRGGGSPLDEGARAGMEATCGTGLGDVRVHTDGEADALNRSVSAQAFTKGSDTFFSSETYQTGASEGTGLLAHELTHVVQERGISRSGPMTVGSVGDSHEQEADAVATRISISSSGVSLTHAPAALVAEDGATRVSEVEGAQAELGVAQARYEFVGAAADGSDPPISGSGSPVDEGMGIHGNTRVEAHTVHRSTNRLIQRQPHDGSGVAAAGPSMRVSGGALTQQVQTPGESAAHETGGGPDVAHGLQLLRTDTMRQAVQAVANHLNQHNVGDAMWQGAAVTNTLNGGMSLADATQEIWYVAAQLYVLDRTGHLTPGEFRFEFDVSSLGPGVYFYATFQAISSASTASGNLMIQLDGGLRVVRGDISPRTVTTDFAGLRERGQAAIDAHHGIGVIVSPHIATQRRRHGFDGHKLWRAICGVPGQIPWAIRAEAAHILDNPGEAILQQIENQAISRVTHAIGEASGPLGIVMRMQRGWQYSQNLAIAEGEHSTEDEIAIASQAVARQVVQEAIQNLVDRGVNRGIATAAGGSRPPPSHQLEAGQAVVTPPQSTELELPSGAQWIDLDRLQYSQDDVGHTFQDEGGEKISVGRLAARMYVRGWDPSRPANVVSMPDGRLVSLDHRRMWAATQAGLRRVTAFVCDANATLPPDQRARFLRAYPNDSRTGQPRPSGHEPTWGDFVRERSASQQPRTAARAGVPVTQEPNGTERVSGTRNVDFPAEGNPTLPTRQPPTRQRPRMQVFTIRARVPRLERGLEPQ